MQRLFTAAGAAGATPGAGALHQLRQRCQEGQYTKVIYNLINERRYADAIGILSYELEDQPDSRAALSLTAFCHFQQDTFGEAASCYEKLVTLFPEVHHYRTSYVQCLSKAQRYEEALKKAMQHEEECEDEYASEDLVKLQTSIRYDMGDFSGAKALVHRHPDQMDPAMLQNLACILYKEERYGESLTEYDKIIAVSGYSPEVAYNVALCYYKLGQYTETLKHLRDIMDRAMREHPELNTGLVSEGIESKSVGNTRLLRQSALVEAFNLKFAMEYNLKNMESAKEALLDMPPRDEFDLDPVTLHNQALVAFENSPADSFEKVNFLLSNTPCPPEAFGNLLLMYCQHGDYDLAADLMADNSELTFEVLAPPVYEFLAATIQQQTAPEEAFRKFEELGKRHIEDLQKFTKAVTEARDAGRDDQVVSEALVAYDAALERYLPVLMAQAKIYWDLKNYPAVESLFRQSAVFCSDHETWRLNVAHVFFMRAKYGEAIQYYAPLVKDKEEELLDIPAIVLANLAVSLVMTSQNSDAEALMRRIEQQEDKKEYSDPENPSYHLCIVNLVIGTLYSSKGNYAFGISRVVKSLDPLEKKLGTNTWFYAKRCLVAMVDALAKHRMTLSDEEMAELLGFLRACDDQGRDIPTIVTHRPDEPPDPAVHNVQYEARLIKKVLLQIRDS